MLLKFSEKMGVVAIACDANVIAPIAKTNFKVVVRVFIVVKFYQLEKRKSL